MPSLMATYWPGKGSATPYSPFMALASFLAPLLAMLTEIIAMPVCSAHSACGAFNAKPDRGDVGVN